MDKLIIPEQNSPVKNSFLERISPAACAFMLAVFVFACMPAFSASGNAAAVVIRCRGLVTVSQEGESGYALASRGYILLNGSTITTGRDGFASVKLTDGRRSVIIRPMSEIIIRDISGTAASDVMIDIKTGSVVTDVVSGKKTALSVNTPAAVAVFNSGRAIVLVSGDNGETTVFNSGISARIANLQCLEWHEMTANTAAFVATGGAIYPAAISGERLVFIMDAIASAQNLTQGRHIDFNCTVNSSPGGTVVPGGTVAALAGVPIDIKAEQLKGFVFSGWNVVSGTARIEDVTQSATRAAVFSDCIIEARFTEKPCILAVRSEGRGSTLPSGDISVPRNSPVTVIAVPDEGYEFKGWKTAGSISISKEELRTASVSVAAGKASITARFARRTYKLALTGKNGKLKPVSAVANHGDTTKISATPAKGFTFITWRVVSGKAKISAPNLPATTVILDSANASIEAIFSNNPVEISVLPHEQAVVTPSGIFNVERNSDITVTVVPNDGMMVSGWQTVRGKAEIEGLENAVVRCRRPFEIQPVVITRTYPLSITVKGSGSAVPSGQVSAAHGTPLTVKAVPAPGKHFIRWKTTGGWASIADPQADSTSVVLSHGPAVVQAEFAATICSLTVKSTSGGYTDPAGVLKSYEGGDVFVKAVPNPRAAFAGWETVSGEKNITFSDTSTVAGQTITSLKQSAEIRAVFSADAVELEVISDGLGEVSPDGKMYVVKDRFNSIKAVPGRGQSFVQWAVVTGTDVRFRDQSSPETEVAITDNSVIKALFSSSDVVFSGTGSSVNGVLKIVCDESRGKVREGYEIKAVSGAPVELTAEPESGYRFTMWRLISGNAVIADQLSATTRVFIYSSEALVEAVFLNKPEGKLEVRFRDYEGRSKTIRSTYY